MNTTGAIGFGDESRLLGYLPSYVWLNHRWGILCTNRGNPSRQWRVRTLKEKGHCFLGWGQCLQWCNPITKFWLALCCCDVTVALVLPSWLKLVLLGRKDPWKWYWSNVLEGMAANHYEHPPKWYGVGWGVHLLCGITPFTLNTSSVEHSAQSYSCQDWTKNSSVKCL